MRALEQTETTALKPAQIARAIQQTALLSLHFLPLATDV